MIVELNAGLVFADAAAAEEQLMRAMDKLVALYEQDITTRTIFHLAMAAVHRQLGIAQSSSSGGIQVLIGLSIKQHEIPGNRTQKVREL